MEQPSTTPHIAIAPSPGMGHLIPLAEFAKRLVHRHSFSVTFVIPNDDSPSKAQRSLLDSLPPSIIYVFLPPVSFDDLHPKTTRIETIITLTLKRSLPSLRNELQRLAESTRLVALIADLFGTDAFAVAEELNVSPYIFFPNTAMCLSLFLHLPTLDEAVSCEYRDLPELVKIPGCIPVHGRDLFDPVQDRCNDAYKWVLHHARRYRLAEGILLNSFEELEPGAIEYLQGEEPGKPLVYPVGPLVNMKQSSKSDGSACLKWLDEQPKCAVLYVSFGNGGNLSYDQIQELSQGLEMSEQRFLWVARTPNDKAANATYLTVDSQNEPLEFLPKGFLERTKGRGLVVPSWAPQAQVLAHSSTCGFLTHCGWNSTLESVLNGVPLIVWPLFAEQRMNALMLTQDIKVALRPRAEESSLVGRDEIAKVVKGLMEGEEGKCIWNRMKDLKDAATKVLSEDGSSTRALSELALKWSAKLVNQVH
ncbi:hydroquinone glucosyltransferase-like [Syzygium oleosum]|uniref:hydroquinone glucosyltransferase-like n=1 Tax=Syzygium oleosum TaxID=219896 RepID=UPI0011D267C5|nr:hydroquinone glucosyltransferase-like [Syzygium oleosum]